MVTTEYLQEGWVKFTRVPCTEGCIDVWYGDCAHDPNRETEPHWCLNSFRTYIRLNGEGKWFSNDYRRGMKSFAMEMGEVATSQEIWDEISKFNEDE